MFSELFQFEQKPVTVYSSADPSAPTLTDAAGSLKTVLKACLVTGYGDKESLGWEMKYETDDLSGAVFVSKDPKSSKFMLKVDNKTKDAKLSAYQSMTDFEHGERPIVVDNKYAVEVNDWMLVGHSRAFILMRRKQIRGMDTAVPIIFGDLPRQTTRVEPLCLMWSAREHSNNSGGLQSTLFKYPSGYGGSAGPTVNNSACYPFVVNNGSGGVNLTKNYCRFSYDSDAQAVALYEQLLSQLPDATWTILPMLQPLSTKLSDVSNLGRINQNTIKCASGAYAENADCAVPTDWWYA